MADTCCEITWLLGLFHTFVYTALTPVILYCDSKSAIYIASNAVFHEHTKHIELDCHLVHEKFQLGVITLAYVSTTDQIADMFTKSLASHSLVQYCSKLGLCNMFQILNLRRDVTEYTAADSLTAQSSHSNSTFNVALCKLAI